MPYDVSVVGPLNIDLLITGDGPPHWEAIPTWDGPARIEMTAAGSVGYTVTNLAKLGLSVQVCSCLPDDPLGDFIDTTLQQAGVNTNLVRKTPKTLGGIGVYMLLFGSRKRPLAYRLPTHELWPSDFLANEQATLLNARLLHQGGYLHYREAWHGGTLRLFREAKSHGLITAMDPQFPLFAMNPPWMVGLADILPYVDILFCDEHEAYSITSEHDLTDAANQLLNAGPHTVIIKQGADGSTLYQNDFMHHQPAILPGQLVDSIGAGDTYDAAFLYGYLQGWTVQECMLFASVAAGFTVTGVGASQTMPSLNVILSEMQKYR